jgi:hypothetical protein
MINFVEYMKEPILEALYESTTLMSEIVLDFD